MGPADPRAAEDAGASDNRRPGGEGGFSPLELVNVLLRHRRAIIAFGVLVPLVSIGFILLRPRSFTSTASFMPQQSQRAGASQLAALAGQFGFNIPTGEAGQSPEFYADLVVSREVLGAVADDTFSVADTLGPFGRGEVTGGLATLLEIEQRAPEPIRRVKVIEWLRENALSVSIGQETGVVRLSVQTRWPELSARIAARLIDLVNQFNLETRQTQAAAERRFIEERMAQARDELRTAEKRLEAFLRNNRQFQNSPELLFENERLERQVNMRQQVFTSLAEAYEQARISEVRNTPVITVVEPAQVPVQPDPRGVVATAALAGALGLGLGALVAFGLEYVDRRRGEDADEYSEFRSLWQETRSDVTGALRRLRPGKG